MAHGVRSVTMTGPMLMQILHASKCFAQVLQLHINYMYPGLELPIQPILIIVEISQGRTVRFRQKYRWVMIETGSIGLAGFIYLTARQRDSGHYNFT